MKRKEKRQLRKERKSLRRKSVEQLIKLGNELNILPEKIDSKNYKEVFSIYWPLMKEGLIFFQNLKITKEKADLKIEEIITLGNAIFKGDASEDKISELQQKFSKAWNYLRKLISLIALFTKGKTDEVLDKIIEVGDWLSGINDEPTESEEI